MIGPGSSSSDCWIYVLVEVAKRELDSRSLIALELVKRGMNVVIGEKNQILWAARLGFCPPGVIFDKCSQMVGTTQGRLLEKKGFVFTSLDEEGLVTDEEYFFNVRFTEQAAKDSALTFCWGSRQHDMILGKYPRANLLISGNPRNSLLHDDFSFWLEDEQREISSTYGEFVLVVSSFNPYPAVYIPENQWLKDVDYNCRRQVDALAKNILETGTRVVCRPHPSDLPSKRGKVEVDSRFNIAPWIKACTLLINAKCSSSFEAYLAGKPCLTFPLRNREQSVRFSNLFARKIKPDDSVADLLRSVPQKHRLLDRVAQFNAAYTSSPSRPVELIADALSGMAFPSRGQPRFWQCSYLLNLRNRLKYRLRGDDYDRVTRKFPVDELNRVHRKFPPFSINSKRRGKMLVLKPNLNPI